MNSSIIDLFDQSTDSKYTSDFSFNYKMLDMNPKRFEEEELNKSKEISLLAQKVVSNRYKVVASELIKQGVFLPAKRQELIPLIALDNTWSRDENDQNKPTVINDVQRYSRMGYGINENFESVYFDSASTLSIKNYSILLYYDYIAELFFKKYYLAKVKYNIRSTELDRRLKENVSNARFSSIGDNYSVNGSGTIIDGSGFVVGCLFVHKNYFDYLSYFLTSYRRPSYNGDVDIIGNHNSILIYDQSTPKFVIDNWHMMMCRINPHIETLHELTKTSVPNFYHMIDESLTINL